METEEHADICLLLRSKGNRHTKGKESGCISFVYHKHMTQQKAAKREKERPVVEPFGM